MHGYLHRQQKLRKKYYVQVRGIIRSTFNFFVYRIKSWCDWKKAMVIASVVSSIVLLVAVIVIPIYVVRVSASRSYCPFFFMFEIQIQVLEVERMVLSLDM